MVTVDQQSGHSQVMGVVGLRDCMSEALDQINRVLGSGLIKSISTLSI